MNRPKYLLTTFSLLTFFYLSGSWASKDSIPRTLSGHPNLTGNYDAATLTPFERPASFGKKAFLTPEEARAIADRERGLQTKGAAQSSSNRAAPPQGGAKVVGLEETKSGGNEFGAGNVGAYNMFWMDRGTDVNIINGKIPTSILIEPANGRLPPMTPEARQAAMTLFASIGRPNDGTAWWVDIEGAAPYDGPESLPLRERCLIGFTGVAPTFPALYNNYKRIEQTDTHVVILLEMVHDARIVRLKKNDKRIEHPPSEIQFWLGDSIGWWEKDTLVVDTTNFIPQEGSRGGGSSDKHVVEHFTMLPGGDILYRFTIEDPAIWTTPWSGQYVWRSSEESVYEYACHEGNYAMENVLRGARLLEAEALGEPLPEIR